MLGLVYIGIIGLRKLCTFNDDVVDVPTAGGAGGGGLLRVLIPVLE